MIEDFDLIESSFLSYYGIRLRKELANMSFSEFRTYLGNLGGDTPFMTTLEIRMTERSKVPKHLLKEKIKQNRIMLKRGYFEDAASNEEGLEKALKANSKPKEG
ncbi:bacteriophage Gp15 family protein [Listeria monocytogenes]|nr:bacteriophage Gp15 family protein [Listeria monocytogenes]MCD7695972.1 bacteriophage Gp15 family protein [Listeria monocytogenes]